MSIRESGIVPTVLYTEKEAAEAFRVKCGTLRVWRCQGRGPRFVKEGRFVRYRGKELIEYCEQRIQQVS